jgi:hypothetical protein
MIYKHIFSQIFPWLARGRYPVLRGDIQILVPALFKKLLFYLPRRRYMVFCSISLLSSRHIPYSTTPSFSFPFSRPLLNPHPLFILHPIFFNAPFSQFIISQSAVVRPLMSSLSSVQSPVQLFYFVQPFRICSTSRPLFNDHTVFNRHPLFSPSS